MYFTRHVIFLNFKLILMHFRLITYYGKYLRKIIVFRTSFSFFCIDQEHPFLQWRVSSWRRILFCDEETLQRLLLHSLPCYFTPSFCPLFRQIHNFLLNNRIGVHEMSSESSFNFVHVHGWKLVWSPHCS